VANQCLFQFAPALPRIENINPDFSTIALDSTLASPIPATSGSRFSISIFYFPFSVFS